MKRIEPLGPSFSRQSERLSDGEAEIYTRRIIQPIVDLYSDSGLFSEVQLATITWFPNILRDEVAYVREAGIDTDLTAEIHVFQRWAKRDPLMALLSLAWIIPYSGNLENIVTTTIKNRANATLGRFESTTKATMYSTGWFVPFVRVFGSGNYSPDQYEVVAVSTRSILYQAYEEGVFQ